MTFTAGQKPTAATMNLEVAAGHEIVRHKRTFASTTTTSSTGIGVIQLNIPVTLGRLYWVGFFTPCHLDSTVTTDNVMAKIVYTTDGSTPTASSPILEGAQAYSLATAVPLATVWAATMTGTLKVWICVGRQAGSGNVRIYADAVGRSMEVGAVDLGPDTGSAGGTNL
jgi:hypothetical protein